jgi:hypothetical protein
MSTILGSNEQLIKDALKKEAAEWLTNNQSLSDWITHVMIDPSDELIAAFRQIDVGDCDEEEEYDDVIEEFIIAAFDE